MARRMEKLTSIMRTPSRREKGKILGKPLQHLYGHGLNILDHQLSNLYDDRESDETESR